MELTNLLSCLSLGRDTASGVGPGLGGGSVTAVYLEELITVPEDVIYAKLVMF